MLNDCLEELQKFLKGEFKKLDVVVMPDFFLDRLVTLAWDVGCFSENLENVAKRKGGAIDEIRQVELRGGNAINTASALVALDVNVTPIVCTNYLGLQLIRFYLNSKKIDFSHVKIFDKASITTAIEFEIEKTKVNVMLRDVGALANFGPQWLDEDDYKSIENADYVCVFNWAGTKRFGTKLTKAVFSHLKMKGKGKSYLDTADPSPNRGKIPELLKDVLQARHVDILSVNENEAISYASQLSSEIEEAKRRLRFGELAKESARILASRLRARIDLHTTSFSSTFTRKDETIVSAFKIPILRVTGAGDAWNAGNILGDACKLSDDCRLTLANLVAAYYISNPKGMHPTKEQLVRFCEKLKQK